MSPPIQSAGLPEVLFMAYWDGERWVDQQPREPRQASKARRAFTHSWQMVLEAALVATLVVGLVAGTAFAGKGGRTTTADTGTLVMHPMDGATEAMFGARVTFTVSTTATPYPYVHLMCYQGGTLVGEGRQGFFSGALGNKWFVLGPTTLWTGGAADCKANLEMSTRKGWSVLGTTSFHVYS